VEGRKLAIAVPDDDRVRSLLEDVAQRKIYRPPPGSPVPRYILDVGANIGITAAYFRLVYPDAAIHCVEPDPFAYDLLASNARSIGNCATYQGALYDATCLWAPRLAKLEAGPGNVRRALCIDAKSFLASLPVDGIDLLKLDAGGAEPTVVWGLRDMLERIPVIHIAYRSERDRRLIDEMLTASHRLWRAADATRSGLLTYTLRGTRMA
jgi:FkbM family methyltransferase